MLLLQKILVWEHRYTDGKCKIFKIFGNTYIWIAFQKKQSHPGFVHANWGPKLVWRATTDLRRGIARTRMSSNRFWRKYRYSIGNSSIGAPERKKVLDSSWISDLKYTWIWTLSCALVLRWTTLRWTLDIKFKICGKTSTFWRLRIYFLDWPKMTTLAPLRAHEAGFKLVFLKSNSYRSNLVPRM